MTVRVTPGRVFASEWTKFRSLRSSLYLVAGSVVIMLGLAALIALAVRDEQGSGSDDFSGVDTFEISLMGFWLAQLTLGVLGVLVVTGEYGTGQVRSTFAAVPRKVPVVLMKTAMIGLVAFVVGLVSAGLAFLLVGAILPSDLDISLSDPGVARGLLGAGLYLAAVAVYGAGIGWLLRHSAGAVAVLMGALLVLPIVVMVIPIDWIQRLGPYLPSRVGQSLLSRAPENPGWTVSLMLTIVYVAVLMGVSAAVVRRRDV